MDNLKKKLFNYAVAAPDDSWDGIISGLAKADVHSFPSRKTNPYLIPLAAALLILLFGAVFFIDQRDKSPQISKLDFKRSEKMATFSSPDVKFLASNKNQTEIKAGVSNAANSYITIASVDGNPVKISPKAASLIVSSDNQYPPKTVWSAKVNRWKVKMLTNPVTPTTANFLDIADLTEALTDRNNSDN